MMQWMKRKATTDELQRELEAHYQSWQEQADRACRPDSTEGATDFGSLNGDQHFATSERQGMSQRRA